MICTVAEEWDSRGRRLRSSSADTSGHALANNQTDLTFPLRVHRLALVLSSALRRRASSPIATLQDGTKLETPHLLYTGLAHTSLPVRSSARCPARVSDGIRAPSLTKLGPLQRITALVHHAIKAFGKLGASLQLGHVPCEMQ